MARRENWRERLRCCLIADPGWCRRDPVATVEAALEGGVRAVQLRDKQATTREIYELARPLRELTLRHGALLLINDRADIALAVGADGVHLGWQSLPAAQVRKLIGRDLLIGKSVHNVEEARQAVAERVDYLIAGPIYDTPSKRGLVPKLGIVGLRQICDLADAAVIALGGIDESNAAEVIEAGADGVAVIRAICAAADPRHAAARLIAALLRRGRAH